MTDPARTRLDPDASSAAPTRIDRSSDDARLDPGATRLDGGVARPRSVFNLPEALAARWRIVEAIPAGGAEAELFVIESIADGAQAVAKIYRPGLTPRSGALERIEGTVHDHVVRVLERGLSDGLAFEVMEYCRHGSLRALLPRCAGAPAMVEAILAELAPALAALHAAGLIHRDLKPENVLVRAIEPLDLVLADFGIASVVDGTHHFTSTSRTVRYAAPEAMTGVISAKADCWSLGMMLLEALTGRHPFEGLSEAVVNHQLVTRSIDVHAIADPAWRALVRGLLLRDPERRWGDEEVRRWLDRDPTFDRTRAPVDEGSSAPLAQPYELEGDRCFTVEELGIALARHWSHGVCDLARGFVTGWLRDELRDRNLVRFVHDLADETRLTPDQRLLRFILRVAPALPAVWKGVSLADDALAAAAARALEGRVEDAQWLAEIYRLDFPALLPGSHPDRERLDALITRWRARVAAFEAAQEALLDAEHAGRREAAQSDGFADMDELMFGREAGTLVRDTPPHATLLAIDLVPGTVERMRRRVTTTTVTVAADAPWFLSLGAVDTLTAEALALLETATPRAQAFAERRRAARARLDQADRDEAARLQRELDTIVRECHAYASDGVSDTSVRNLMRSVHRRFVSLHSLVHDEAHAKPAMESVRLGVRKAAPSMHAIAHTLDRLDYLDRVRFAVLSRGGRIAFAVILILLLFRAPVLVYGAIGVIAAATVWYFWERSAALRMLARAVRRMPVAAGPRPNASV